MIPAPEFSRSVQVERLRADGEQLDLVASPAECEAVARRLGLESVAELSAGLLLVPQGRGLVAAEGSVRARVVQVCVVSLEPFEQALDIPLRLVFRPGTEADLAADQTLDPESEDEVPYEGGRIDLGETVVETLALAVDPWPRRPGAVLEMPEAGESAPDRPFAALAKRRRER